MYNAVEGAIFYSDTPVTDIEIEDGHVKAVITPHGQIRTDIVVVAAGIWGPLIGRMAGITLPLYPMEHPQIKLGPIPELADETIEITQPALRYPDQSMYCRQYFKHYEVGSYRHRPVLFEPADILPYGQTPTTPAMTSFRPELFTPALSPITNLMPTLATAPIVEESNGMFSFTVDGMPILGESPMVQGFWTAEAVWVAHSAGVGKVMAEWIIEGSPSLDLHEADISRFHPYQMNSDYIKSRTAQQYKEVYDIIHPLAQAEQPRKLQTSPFYLKQKELGGIFMEMAGWERPQWYGINERLLEGMEYPDRHGWEKQHWSPIIYAEHQATRERAAMIDLTSFAKIEVTGPMAVNFLQRIASNNLDRPCGSIVYTSMLTEQGGIKCDLTVTRLEPNRFLIVTGGGLANHDLAWIRKHLPSDSSVVVKDISSTMCCIGLWGPRSRQIIQQVTNHDMSNKAFPYLDAQELSIGDIPCLALRISYVGELGWELYCATELGSRLWETLWNAGQQFELASVGMGAFDSLRLEKGYRLWGSEIDTEHNPFEAGLEFTVQLDKKEFIGKAALKLMKSKGIDKKLCCMTLNDPTAVIMGGEPILDGDMVLGYVTSANYGYTIKRTIAYGYLPNDHASEGTVVDIEYFGERFKASVEREPLYDPTGGKLKN